VSERWRKPVLLVGIESSLDTMTIGTRVYRDYEYIMKREDWDRIREGYVCIQCFEPHETPFPERCPLCGTTAREQRERIPQEFSGETLDLDPRYEDEEAQLQEENERLLRQKRDSSQIWLPNKEE
jgi:hypothetical protein